MESAEDCVSRFFVEKTNKILQEAHSPNKTLVEEFSALDSSHDSSQTSANSDADTLSLSELCLKETMPFDVQPFYNATPRKMPESPHYVIEEEFGTNPWAMLVATIFLTKTRAKTARSTIKSFFSEYPSPYHVLNDAPTSLERYFEKLGLKKRGFIIWRLSYQFVSAKWRRASDLCGVGKYGEDAYRIFYLGHTDLDPGDRYLRLYLDWLRGHTGFAEENGINDSEYLINDPVSKYYRITLHENCENGMLNT